METMKSTSADGRAVRLLLTPEEAAAALGIKRAKLYQLIMAREIFSVKIGASRRFPLKALEEYVEHLCATQRKGERG